MTKRAYFSLTHNFYYVQQTAGVVSSALLHAQKAGNHIDVLEVETGDLVLDLHQYLWRAAELSVCIHVTSAGKIVNLAYRQTCIRRSGPSTKCVSGFNARTFQSLSRCSVLVAWTAARCCA